MLNNKKINLNRAIVSWSGGKDSCLALERARKNGLEIVALITAIDDISNASKSNSVPIEILQSQAKVLGVPLVHFLTNWKDYEEKLVLTLRKAREIYNADYCVFGDIDIEHHRAFEEKVSSEANLKAILPLWNEKRNKLAKKVIKTGIKARVSVIRNKIVPETFLGSDYNKDFIAKLSKLEGIDICGENGEFHTIVYDSPSFKKPINIDIFRIERADEYSFCIFELNEHNT